MDEQIKDLESEISKLRDKIHFFDKVFWAVVAVAAIFGVSGAWGLSVIVTASQTITELEKTVKDAEGRIDDLQASIGESEAQILVWSADAQDKIETKFEDSSKALDARLQDVSRQLTAKVAQFERDTDAIQRDAYDDIQSAVASAIEGYKIEVPQSIQKELATLHGLYDEAIKEGDEVHIMSSEGFLLSNDIQNQDEKDVLITQRPSSRTTWTLRR
ncbi:hypothetical protein [Labrenzia sp. DG1229]|uniref:hypothetical protein n=1 Tax=Labrenzia sp. DG1229 TaxID=681847 RepID=UPI00048EC605|nr:hypothetical protein [Labrenzia sp. DG1229]